jgi:hypothetical protein
MAELARVVKPGGYVVFSTIDENHCELLAPDELERLRKGEIVVQQANLAGQNSCMSFYPPSYVEARLAKGLIIVDHVPKGIGQNSYVFRKPAETQ